MAIIEIQIKLQGDGFPTPEELEVRHKLEDTIEERNIGEVVDAGGGGGVMDVGVEVEDGEKAMNEIQNIITGISFVRTTRIGRGLTGTAIAGGVVHTTW
jgi:hypothetical protein